MYNNNISKNKEEIHKTGRNNNIYLTASYIHEDRKSRGNSVKKDSVRTYSQPYGEMENDFPAGTDKIGYLLYACMYTTGR